MEDWYALSLGTYGSIRHEHCVRETPTEHGDAIRSESALVEHTADEDLINRISGAV
jgi:hypothetical protein